MFFTFEMLDDKSLGYKIIEMSSPFGEKLMLI